MTTIRFEEVRIKGIRRWKEDGKWRQQTKTFFQTINPFNKDEDGLPKSRNQIIAELRAERDAWYDDACARDNEGDGTMSGGKDATKKTKVNR